MLDSCSLSRTSCVEAAFSRCSSSMISGWLASLQPFCLSRAISLRIISVGQHIWKISTLLRCQRYWRLSYVAIFHQKFCATNYTTPVPSVYFEIWFLNIKFWTTCWNHKGYDMFNIYLWHLLKHILIFKEHNMKMVTVGDRWPNVCHWKLTALLKLIHAYKKNPYKALIDRF